MTLEGEYYHNVIEAFLKKEPSRNPHDIGRRILQKKQKKEQKKKQKSQSS